MTNYSAMCSSYHRKSDYLQEVPCRLLDCDVLVFRYGARGRDLVILIHVTFGAYPLST
jgi:hypothetical protein